MHWFFILTAPVWVPTIIVASVVDEFIIGGKTTIGNDIHAALSDVDCNLRNKPGIYEPPYFGKSK